MPSYECDKIVKRLSIPNMIAEDYKPPQTPEEFESMIRGLGKELSYIFGDNWRENRSMLDKKPWKNLMYDIWLSKKGYYIHPVSEKVPDRNSLPYFSELEMARQLRIFEVIEKNLQFKHPDLTIKLRMKDNKTPYVLEWEHYTRSYSGDLGESIWNLIDGYSVI